MLAELSIRAFNEKLSANTPTPGGGAVAALNGATAASLIAMVASLSMAAPGKTKKGASSAEDDQRIFREYEIRAIALRDKLLDGIDRDADAFDKVMAAYKMPTQNDQNKSERRQAIQDGLQSASRIPLEAANDALTLMHMAAFLIEKGNQNALSDSQVALLTAHAGLRGSLLNVQLNLESIRDPYFCQDCRKQLKKLTLEADQIVSRFL